MLFYVEYSVIVEVHTETNGELVKWYEEELHTTLLNREQIAKVVSKGIPFGWLCLQWEEPSKDW